MTIKHKLILIIMLTCTIVLLLAGTLNLFHQRIKVRKELILSISCYAQIIGENCRAALSFEDAKDASEMLKSLEVKSSIVFACIYTKEGKVLARYQRPDITENIPAPACAKECYQFDNHYFNLFKQIDSDDEVIGTVFIQFDTSEVKTQFRLEAGTTILFVLACSLVAYLVSSRLQRVISGPIVGLAEVAKVVSEDKDYSTRALKQGNDEVGLLIDAFNAMLEQIQQSDSDLREARDKLEERVRKRTAELTHANEQLTREVDERAKAEQQIQQQNKFLNTILESLTHPFCVIDANDHTVKMANSAAKRQRAGKLFDGTTCYRLNHIGDKPCDTVEDPCPIEEIKRTGKPAVVEHVHYDADRNPMFVEVHAYPIFDDDGKLCEIIEYSFDITDRKKAEEALYASHQIIEGIINAIPVRVFWKDKNLVYLGCNAIFARDAGFTDPKDLVGKDDYQMGWRDQAELYRSDDRQVIESGRPKLLIEEPQTTPEGNRIALLTSKVPLCDSKGEIIGVIGTYMDITERKQAEETLRESENKYRTLIENLPQRVFSKDRKSIYISCNGNYARDVGIGPEQVKGKTDYDFYPKELAEKYRQDDKRIMETGRTENIEERYIQQGQELIVQTVKTPIRDEQGNIVGVLGIFWDITDHKNIETALRKGEERFRQVVESAGDWIWEVDAEGLYIYASPIVEKVLGYKPEEIVGKKHFYDFFAPDVKEKLKKAAFEAFTKRKSFKGFINPNIHKNGSTVIMETSGTSIIDEKGNLCGYRGADKDITERQQKEKELQKVHEELVSASHRAGMAEVAADVLHNVGNVLNSINVSTTLITEKITRSELANLQKVSGIIDEHLEEIGTFLTEHPQGKHIPVYLTEVCKCLQGEQEDIISKLRVLADNVQHIKDIISMQQAYAKISGVSVRASLGQLVEDAIQINSAGLQRHGTRLIREFDELPDVEIDKQKVLQILVNLISNAKYALSDSKKEEKLLTIRIYKYGQEHFRIEVADNGVGISEKNLTKIFSHGFTTKRHGHGFGLHSGALAANEMGGSLTVHSDGIEQGATFTLELPFKPIKVMS